MIYEFAATAKYIKSIDFFSRATLTIALVLAVVVSVCPFSVCLSVTSRCSIETAKRRITQTMPHDSPGTVVL